MISCCIVGGETGYRLADYIENNAGGSIKVSRDHLFNSLSGDFETLNNTFIKVDKFIYLLDSSRDYKKDFNALFNLMSNTAFFRIGELWVFATDNDVNNSAITLLNSILDETGFDNIYVRTYVEGALTLSEIYRELTGMKSADDSKVDIIKVYRSKRSDEANTGYDPEYYTKNIELKQPNGYAEYEQVKASALKSETNIPIIDSDYKEIKKVDLDISPIDAEAVSLRKNVIVVSGLPKSGTSSLSSCIATSLSKSNKRVSFLDVSSSYGGERCLESSNHPHVIVDNKELLLGSTYENSNLTVLTSKGIKSEECKISYVKYFKSIPNHFNSDYTVIDCDINFLDKIVSLFKVNIDKVFLCSQILESEVELLKPYVQDYVKGFEVLVYLNNSFSLAKGDSLSPVKAKEILGGVKVIKPIVFKESTSLSSLIL